MDAMPRPQIFRVAAAVLLLSAAAERTTGQPEHPPGLYHYPVRLQPSEFRSSLVINFARAPEDIIEEASFIRAPLFTWDVRYGLPQGFQLTGALTTMIITNHIAVGANWVYEFDRLHAELGYRVAYWFGFMNVEGFDNTASGWFNYPGLSVGYDFGPLAVTLRGELSVVTSLTTYAGDLETSSDYNFYNGGSLALMLEQPLWKDNYVTLGLRISHVKFFYPTWVLFPTFNRYYYIPELILGIRL
jgi:hypothetical protein